MISEPPEYDPITVWQSQRQHDVPSQQDILRRSREYEAKIRRASVIFGVALLLHLALSITEDIGGFKGRIWWVGVIRFALMIVWVYNIPSSAGRRDSSSLMFLTSSAITPVFDFYRRQLQHRRDYFRDDYRRILQVGLIGVGFVLYSIFYPSLFLVFGIPLAVCAVLIYKRRQLELPKIQEELELLDRLNL